MFKDRDRRIPPGDFLKKGVRVATLAAILGTGCGGAGPTPTPTKEPFISPVEKTRVLLPPPTPEPIPTLIRPSPTPIPTATPELRPSPTPWRVRSETLGFGGREATAEQQAAAAGVEQRYRTALDTEGVQTMLKNNQTADALIVVSRGSGKEPVVNGYVAGTDQKTQTRFYYEGTATNAPFLEVTPQPDCPSCKIVWNPDKGRFEAKDSSGKLRGIFKPEKGEYQQIFDFNVSIESQDPRKPGEDWFKDSAGPERFREAVMRALAKGSSIAHPNAGTEEQIFAVLQNGEAGPDLDYNFSLPETKAGLSQEPVVLKPAKGLRIIYTNEPLEGSGDERVFTTGCAYVRWKDTESNTILVNSESSPMCRTAGPAHILLGIALGHKVYAPGAGHPEYLARVAPKVYEALGIDGVSTSLPLTDFWKEAAKNSIFK
jgi:hypothetical protein